MAAADDAAKFFEAADNLEAAYGDKAPVLTEFLRERGREAMARAYLETTPECRTCRNPRSQDPCETCGG